MQTTPQHNLLLQQQAYLSNAAGVQQNPNSQYAANIRNNRLCQKYLMNAAAAAAQAAVGNASGAGAGGANPIGPNYYESIAFNHNHNHQHQHQHNHNHNHNHNLPHNMNGHPQVNNIHSPLVKYLLDLFLNYLLTSNFLNLNYRKIKFRMNIIYISVPSMFCPSKETLIFAFDFFRFGVFLTKK